MTTTVPIALDMPVPTGDVERDMASIKAFYAPIRGKNPMQFEA